jgi:hypothetical protein
MSYLGPENEILDMQDENDELRKTLRGLRTKVSGCLDDLKGANRRDLEEILTDTIEILNNALLDIDSVL